MSLWSQRGLEERWAAIGIRSGSVKKRVLKELQRHGLIRLEHKGRRACVHLYNRAYALFGVNPPKHEGVGGTTHRVLVGKVARMFAARGYEVHIEAEIGVPKKRVDAVCYGRRIIGVEVGLTDARQELKNLRDDLETGVLDLLVFVTTSALMLKRVSELSETDPIVGSKLDRVRFFLLEESDGP